MIWEGSGLRWRNMMKNAHRVWWAFDFQSLNNLFRQVIFTIPMGNMGYLRCQKKVCVLRSNRKEINP